MRKSEYAKAIKEKDLELGFCEEGRQQWEDKAAEHLFEIARLNKELDDLRTALQTIQRLASAALTAEDLTATMTFVNGQYVINNSTTASSGTINFIPTES